MLGWISNSSPASMALGLGVRVMVFNATFNNTISWWSLLLAEETGVPGENH
jgi:hypothetical protein